MSAGRPRLLRAAAAEDPVDRLWHELPELWRGPVAAIQAVLDGTEAITKATLESIPVDIASDGEHLAG